MRRDWASPTTADHHRPGGWIGEHHVQRLGLARSHLYILPRLVTLRGSPERSRGRSQRRDLHPPPTADALARARRYAIALGAIGGADEIVFVVLFGLGRLADHRCLGGVELQTLVPCSLSRSLDGGCGKTGSAMAVVPAKPTTPATPAATPPARMRQRRAFSFMKSVLPNGTGRTSPFVRR